ncbi:metal ABC transporter substrate-binding protein [Georgenia sp. SUBG003]|uniref:metal ABC transporter substrate-binding protein n=1 Tax=Georgenia sp. SUBG003 TaxID=1497974 RepID=UPI003AB5A6F0
MLASFYPLQFVAEEVGGEDVSVSSMTPPGGDAHTLELAPAEVRAIGRADLVVYQSGFQPTVDEAVSVTAPEHVVDLADLATTPGDPLLAGPDAPGQGRGGGGRRVRGGATNTGSFAKGGEREPGLRRAPAQTVAAGRGPRFAGRADYCCATSLRAAALTMAPRSAPLMCPSLRRPVVTSARA